MPFPRRLRAHRPISNQAEPAPDAAAENALTVAFILPQDPPKGSRHRNPEDRGCQDQRWPIIRHTRNPRDCLVSFGIVFDVDFRGLPGSPVRLTPGAEASKARDIVETSQVERPAYTQPSPGDTATTFLVETPRPKKRGLAV